MNSSKGVFLQWVKIMIKDIYTEPEKLVAYVRDGLIEQEHFGFVVRCDNERVLEKIGDDAGYPFYLRSCAKPLQATLIVDYELDKKYDLTEEEIAICCASHAGEKVHCDLIKSFLAKMEIPEEKLRCGIHSPLSKTTQKEMLLNNENPTSIHNNCSGKHAMMLAICKHIGWDMDNYYKENHPLQREIKDKIYDLCDIKSDYPITKDGCGVPIFSMPLANMVKGYLNVFCNPKYEKIKNAFLNNPYIIGGEDRTDTKIISSCSDIVAKVGAGGLCIVVNTELEEGFVVKVCDSNMAAREIIVADLVKNMHWGEIPTNRDIRTLHGDVVGEIVTLI